MTSIRLPVSTSLTSRTERSWPIASGVSASGNGTESRSGRTGRASGRFERTSAVVASPSRGRDVDAHASRSSIGTRLTSLSGRASGTSISSSPSS